jgi:cystathionine beta-lyase
MAAHGEKSKGTVLTSTDLDGHDMPPSPAPSTPRNGRRYALATELVYTESSDQYNSSSMPIYQVSFYGLLPGFGLSY